MLSSPVTAAATLLLHDPGEIHRNGGSFLGSRWFMVGTRRVGDGPYFSERGGGYYTEHGHGPDNWAGCGYAFRGEIGSLNGDGSGRDT